MASIIPANAHSLKSDWLVFAKPKSQARMRLFCFPYAGSGTIVYRTWQAGLPDEIEVVSILLPGRETRLREPAWVSFRPLVQTLRSEIQPFLDLPFAFFGHSLGALIAFETARLLRKQAASLPHHLFFSARRAPQLPNHMPPIHALQDSAFIDAIQKRYNGIPQIILQDPELTNLFIPILKADFSVLETYHYQPEPALPIPVSVFGGQSDPIARQEELTAWRDHTSQAFSLTMFEGDHFFIQNRRQAVLHTLSDILTVYL